MILDDFCLFPAHVCYVIVHVMNFESHVQFADRCAPVKVTSSAENSVLQALQFQDNECITFIYFIVTMVTNRVYTILWRNVFKINKLYARLAINSVLQFMYVKFQRESGRFSVGITFLLYILLHKNHILKIKKVRREAKNLETLSNTMNNNNNFSIVMQIFLLDALVI
jgi:hypothetical protein